MSYLLKKIHATCFMFALFFVSCSTMQLPTDCVPVRADAFGLAHAQASESEYPLLQELGASWIRQTFHWDTVNPAPDVWNFEYFDGIVDGAASHGKSVIAVLAYDVAWIHASGSEERDITPKLLPHYLAYVRAVVTRYRGRVGAWEIWNEPNWVFWKGSDRDFYELAFQAAKLIKSLDPSTPVLVGSTFRTDEDFITGLFRKGVFSYADALSIHPYATNPTAVAKQIVKAKALLNRLGLGDRELWLTEIGYPNHGLYPNKVSPDSFPEYVLKTLVAATAEKAAVIIWYEHFDSGKHQSGHIDIDSAYSFGLRYNDGSLKEGARAFKAFTTRVAGSVYDPAIVKVDQSLADVVPASFRDSKSGRTTLVIWRDNGRVVPVCIQVSAGFIVPVYPEGLKPFGASQSPQWVGPLGSSPTVFEAYIPDGATVSILMSQSGR